MYQTELKREEKLDKQNEKQRQDKHLELICWILEQYDWENNLIIIKGQEYDRFMKSDNEDDEMDMHIIECNEFYDKFEEITGVQLLEISDFISMTYIDKARNDIELIINNNGNNERYIIGV